MTREPLPTTHNAEHGARSTCKEELKTAVSGGVRASTRLFGGSKNRLESKYGENNLEKNNGDIRRLENI